MYKTSKKIASLMLTAAMTLSLIPSAFAENASASLNYDSSTGYYDVSVQNLAKPEGSSLYYKNGTSVAIWDKENVSLSSLDGLSVQYSATVPTVDDAAWTAVAAGDVTAVNNKEVANALHNYSTTVTIPSLDEFSRNIDNLSGTLAITNGTQKNFVVNKVNGWYSTVNTQYKAVKDINSSVSSMTTDSAISNAYSRLATATNTVNSATNSTFRTAVLSYIGNVRDRIDTQKENVGIRSDLENNILNLFDSFISKGVVYPLRNVIVDTSNANIKLIFQTSAGVNSLKKGDIEAWLSEQVIPYVISTNSRWNDIMITVEVSMPTNNGTTTAMFKYAAGFADEYDEERMEELLDSISTSFEYLTFDHHLVYVGTSGYANDTSGYGTNNRPTILVIADGGFSRSDSDWTKKNTLDFVDWYTYDVAEPIINETDMDVRILFYDENEYLLTSALVTASSLGGGSGNTSFSNIQSMLNRDFDEYDDLEFSYTVGGTSKTINVTMKGTNFREVYDIWQEVDRTDFDNWVNKSIILSILTYADADVRIKLVDKNGKSLDTYEAEYDDVAVDIEDVEDYLNNSYYLWNGLYWDWTVKMTDDGTKVVAKGDFKSNDSTWKNITANELQAWAREIAVYVIESIPRNLEIEFQNTYSSTLKTFSYNRAGFSETLSFENKLNSSDLSYDGYDFTAEVSYSASNVTVKLYSDDFDKNDTGWKDIRSTTAFKSWVENTIAGPATSEFNKAVKVYFYDEDGDQAQTFSFSKNFNYTTSNSTNVKEMVNFLNKYLGTMDPDASSKVTATHSATTKNDVVNIKTRLNTTYNAKNWTDKDAFQYNRFISLIMARAAWTNKDVELTVVDKNGKNLGTYSSSQYTQDEYKKGVENYSDGNRYAPNSGYIYLSKELYERSANNFDINEQVVSYLKELGEKTQYKLLLPVADGNAIKLHISKQAAGLLKTANYTLILDGSAINIQIKGNSLGNYEYDVNIRSVADMQVPDGVYMPSVYELSANKNLSVVLSSGLTSGTVYRYQNNKWNSNVSSVGSVNNIVFGVAMKTVNFNDISGSNYQDSIRKLASYGIMNGVGNNNFQPYTELSRAEAAQIIVNGIAPATTPNGYFVDVSNGAWYYNAVMKASSLGIVKGIGNNMFAPDQKVTYDEYLAMLRRTGDSLKLNKTNVSTSVNGIVTADWAAQDAAYMLGLGVISRGYVGSDVVTREVAAELMCRYLVAIGYIA